MLGYFRGVAVGHCNTTKGQKTPKKVNKGSWTQKHNINKPNVKYNMKLEYFY
jgi:hypothetical protein